MHVRPVTAIRRLLQHLQVLNSAPDISRPYVTSAPNPQNALDIFRGEWWTQMPEPFSGLSAGEIRLFEDPRVQWALSQLGNVEGQSVLELGPLEGAHTYMLERAGFKTILSIEANPRAFLKCLVMKEILELKRCRFVCGDFLAYLHNCPAPVDAVIACGVLYHMADPVELIGLLSKITRRLFVWTHYYDERMIPQNRNVKRRFRGNHRAEYGGFEHQVFRYEYGGRLQPARFCGGPRPYAHWMLREEILGSLKHFGFQEIQTSFERPDHPNGPAFAVMAQAG